MRRPQTVIHHSDHGCQYTSYAFGKRCREAGIMPSMGTVGDAYDNAMAESFFATLEREVLNRRRFKSQAEAKMAIFDWLKVGTTHIADTRRWVAARRSTTSAMRCRARRPEMRPPTSHGLIWRGIAAAGTPAIAALGASYAVDFLGD